MKKNKLSFFLVIFCAAVLWLNYAAGSLNIDFELIAAKLFNKYPESVPSESNSTYEPGESLPETTDSEPAAENEYDFKKTITIHEPEAFFDCLAKARDSLIPVINLKITDYDDDAYDIHKFERGKYSLASEGKSIGKTAYMTYTFKFSDNYAISRACEDETLIPRLTAEQQQAISKLYAIKDLLIRDNMSDYEKELAIHDYITKNYEYDTEAPKQEHISDEATSIVYFLTSHKGVCEAYSYTFKALCNICGIRCYVVTGTLKDVGHAWNVIELDGSYYNIDVTSDDPVPDMPQHCFYTYFNVTDAEISKSHIFEDKKYECTDDRYNYFIYNDFVVNDYQALHELIIKRLSQGYDTVIFKKQGFTLSSDDIGKLLSGKGFSSYVISGNLDDPYGDHEIQLS